MNVKDFFPMWDQLTKTQQTRLISAAIPRSVEKGTIVHNGSINCTGLLLVEQGQLRAYILSDEGREITIYRLFHRDICLFSASCMMHSIQFDVIVQAESQTSFWIIPADVYQDVMKESAALANYTNEIMATRFSEVMWLMERILWKRMDKRIAGFLLEESAVEKSTVLKITHETIANHLGTAREVVTRMLRYLQSEGLVKLSRGTIALIDIEGLSKLQAS
ncbi:MAG: Crp/Fnr family transcriptional regulator [Oscillospiraceae bacterium]|nr:Crp/Fnr family transcriptional regulator [Oscillospiraceae bacterium]